MGSRRVGDGTTVVTTCRTYSKDVLGEPAMHDTLAYETLKIANRVLSWVHLGVHRVLSAAGLGCTWVTIGCCRRRVLGAPGCPSTMGKGGRRLIGGGLGAPGCTILAVADGVPIVTTPIFIDD